MKKVIFLSAVFLVLILNGCARATVPNVMEAVEMNGCKFSYVEYNAKRQDVKMQCVARTSQ